MNKNSQNANRLYSNVICSDLINKNMVLFISTCNSNSLSLRDKTQKHAYGFLRFTAFIVCFNLQGNPQMKCGQILK